MKKQYFLVLISFIFFSPLYLNGQQIIVRDQRVTDCLSLVKSENITKTIEDLVSFYTRHNLSTQNEPKTGIGAASLYIKMKLDDFAKNSNHMSVQSVIYPAGGKGSRLHREVKLMNIVANFKGDNPSNNREIILLAHFDSRSYDNNDSLAFAPGANDNGSGVAALMEIARILSVKPLPISVKLVFLSGEEHGLLGATHMAKMAKKESWNIVTVINNDMIGNSRSSGTEISGNTQLRVFSENIPYTENDQKRRIREFNSGENDSESRQIARYIKEVSERYVDNLFIKLIYRNDRFGRGGDHTPFNKEGFPSVRLCEYYENYNRTHQIPETKDGIEYGDLIKGVDIEYVRKNTQANLSTILNLAFAPDVPKNVKIDISGLSSSTYLTWEAPKSGTAPAGYYVLIRETDKSMWEKKILITGNSVELPFSKDNHLFSVQSVSKEGNESLPVLALGGSR